MLTVASGMCVAEPLLLELAQGASGAFLRIEVRLEEGSSLTLLERQRGDRHAFFSAVSNLTLEAGAQLTHQRLGLIGGEGRWLSQHAVTLGSRAHYGLLLAQGGAAFRRNELSIDLRGHRATVAVSGASLTDGAQHLDTQLAMNHCDPRAPARSASARLLQKLNHPEWAHSHPSPAQKVTRQRPQPPAVPRRTQCQPDWRSTLTKSPAPTVHRRWLDGAQFSTCVAVA